MEKETMTLNEEIACIGLYSKNWPSTAVVATTGAELLENEGEFGLGQVREIYAGVATEAFSIGSRVAGPLLVEESYAMELADWVRYYWLSGSQKGLLCMVAPEWSESVGEYLVVCAAESTSSMGFLNQHDNRLIYSAISPKEPPLSKELSDFCVRYELSTHLRVAIGLLKTSFPSVERLNLQLERDPETGDEWILINFDVTGEVEDVLSRYDHYTELFVKSVPWPDRDKIRIAYNIM
jgi:hypothetical protein